MLECGLNIQTLESSITKSDLYKKKSSSFSFFCDCWYSSLSDSGSAVKQSDRLYVGKWMSGIALFPGHPQTFCCSRGENQERKQGTTSTSWTNMVSKINNVDTVP